MDTCTSLRIIWETGFGEIKIIICTALSPVGVFRDLHSTAGREEISMRRYVTEPNVISVIELEPWAKQLVFESNGLLSAMTGRQREAETNILSVHWDWLFDDLSQNA